MRRHYVIAGAAAALVWASAGFGQDLPAAPFTAAQVDAGRQAYVEHCMMCHGAKLQGHRQLLQHQLRDVIKESAEDRDEERHKQQ